jgi:transposase-like protein
LALSLWWRRARQHFSIDAPRMAVRSRLPWPWRAVAGATLLAIVAGMWWWGYDFGQIFGGFNRTETRDRIAALEAENAGMRAENAQLRARTMQLESELAITAGAQASLSKQAIELQNENSQIKEELAFLQKLVADSNKQVGLSIQRLVVEHEREDAWRYSLLVVRGGNPKDEFDGHLTLQVTVQPGAVAGRPAILTLPDDQPGTEAALKLKFKYYQRLEGTFGVPKGGAVRAVTVRAFESGQASPRATRNLVIP